MSSNHSLFSVLICHKESTPFKKLNFLFQLAYHYAEKGFLVFIISKTVIHSNTDVYIEPHTSKPEILQRIIFRYFLDSSEILNWCHQIHNKTRLPHLVLLSGLEAYSPINEFPAVEICAALLDLMQFCSRSTKKQSYLLISLSDNKCESSLSHLLTFFDRVWYLEGLQSNIHLFSLLFPSVADESLRKINISVEEAS